MSYGFEVYSSGGSQWFSLSDRLIRYVDYFRVTSQTGSRTIPGLGSDGFFIVQAEGGMGTGGYEWGSADPSLTAQYFWREGDTLRWDYNYSHHWSPVNDRDAKPVVHVLVVLFR